MRLIDADELKKLILAELDKIPEYHPLADYEIGTAKRNLHGDLMRGGIRIALRCMEQCPTVDAKPVVHGKWVDRYGLKYANHLYECSVCKNPALYMPVTDSLGSDHIYQATTLYCPYCGAKMDGDGNG